MGNQARWREIQRFVRKFKTTKSIHDMQFWVFLFCVIEDMRTKVRQNKFGANGYCISFPVIPKAQYYRECMETKKAISRNSKERISSPVHLSCEHELICVVYEGESI